MTVMSEADVGRRLARLERECRLLRGAVGLGALGFLVAVAMGQAAPVPKVVQAETFQVVNSEGTVLAGLGVDDRMRSALKLYSENGKPQVVLGAGVDGGGSLGFVEKGEQLRVLVQSAPGHGAAFIVKGDGEGNGVGLSWGPAGSGLNIGDGKVSVSLAAAKGVGEFCIGGSDPKLSASVLLNVKMSAS